MSKKKNKKFKKPQAVRANPIREVKNTDQTAPSALETDQTNVQEAEKAKDEIEILNEKYLPVQRDVFKLFAVIGCLAIIFIIIYIISIETSTLTSIGDWIYAISKIQTQ